MANIIAATQGSATSPEFSVTTPLHLHCFPDGGSEYVGYVEKKNSDGTFTRLRSPEQPGKAPTDVFLSQIYSSRLIQSPGTYRFVKSATTVSIGVDTEG